MTATAKLKTTAAQDVLKNKLADLAPTAKVETKAPATATSAQAPIAQAPAKTLVEAQKFQEYKCSRSSVRLITTGGIKITFTNFRLLTQTVEVIEYLDAEIEIGLPGITRGELLTLDEVNPMQTLRRELELKIRKEMQQEASDKIAGITRDMGETEQKALISPASTVSVAR